jgi:hypothetical protein
LAEHNAYSYGVTRLDSGKSKFDLKLGDDWSEVNSASMESGIPDMFRGWWDKEDDISTFYERFMGHQRLATALGLKFEGVWHGL